VSALEAKNRFEPLIVSNRSLLEARACNTGVVAYATLGKRTCLLYRIIKKNAESMSV